MFLRTLADTIKAFGWMTVFWTIERRFDLDGFDFFFHRTQEEE